MNNNEKHQSALFAATAHLRELHEAEEAERTKPIPRLSAEEREENRRKAKERQRLSDGLARLREGQPCTPTQAPVVGAYVGSYEEKIKALQGQVRTAEIDAYREREMYRWITEEWNGIIDMLKDLGIETYEGSRGHAFIGTNKDGKHVEEHFDSMAAALKAALQWWKSQG